MATKEFPNYRQLKTGLQRIIAESVAETINETDHEIAVSWRSELQRKKREQAASRPQAGSRKPLGASAREQS